MNPSTLNPESSSPAERIQFSMAEIAHATGAKPEVLEGVSYAALQLDVPLSEGRILRFREGDDTETDHSVEIINPLILNPLILNRNPMNPDPQTDRRMALANPPEKADTLFAAEIKLGNLMREAQGMRCLLVGSAPDFILKEIEAVETALVKIGMSLHSHFIVERSKPQ